MWFAKRRGLEFQCDLVELRVETVGRLHYVRVAAFSVLEWQAVVEGSKTGSVETTALNKCQPKARTEDKRFAKPDKSLEVVVLRGRFLERRIDQRRDP